MNKQKIEWQDRVIQYGLILISVALIVVGLYRDELQVVLKKAINICLECIGIG